MSIVRMKKLQAIVLRQQREEIMLALMRLGCVQVHEPAEALSDPEVAEILHQERADLPRLRTNENELNTALHILARFAPEKRKLLSARPEVSVETFLNEDVLMKDGTASPRRG